MTTDTPIDYFTEDGVEYARVFVPAGADHSTIVAASKAYRSVTGHALPPAPVIVRILAGVAACAHEGDSPGYSASAPCLGSSVHRA
jgi:hypothetical protein